MTEWAITIRGQATLIPAMVWFGQSSVIGGALITPPWVGQVMGIGWAAAMAARIGGAVPFIIDCGDQPGDAMAAARSGLVDILCRVEGERHDRLTAILAAQGARLSTRRPVCFDWQDPDITLKAQQRLILALDQWYSDVHLSPK
jgi:hypothetical protein